MCYSIFGIILEAENQTVLGESMEREIDLSQVSDGKLYTANDMVRAACNDCAGCSLCCHVVGKSIILDPYDLYQMEKGLSRSFGELLQEALELRVVDGIVMPNIRIQGEQGGCSFLNEQGRCSIHAYRPGFCRMFPLGRIYEKEQFHYFLQIHECPYPDKTKIKVKQWLGIPELPRYEKYICDWHFFLKKLQENLKEEEQAAGQLSMYLLQLFFERPYNTEIDFYPQFYERLKKASVLTGESDDNH